MSEYELDAKWEVLCGECGNYHVCDTGQGLIQVQKGKNYFEIYGIVNGIAYNIGLQAYETAEIAMDWIEGRYRRLGPSILKSKECNTFRVKIDFDCELLTRNGMYAYRMINIPLTSTWCSTSSDAYDNLVATFKWMVDIALDKLTVEDGYAQAPTHTKMGEWKRTGEKNSTKHTPEGIFRIFPHEKVLHIMLDGLSVKYTTWKQTLKEAEEMADAWYKETYG